MTIIHLHLNFWQVIVYCVYTVISLMLIFCVYCAAESLWANVFLTFECTILIFFLYFFLLYFFVYILISIYKMLFIIFMPHTSHWLEFKERTYNATAIDRIHKSNFSNLNYQEIKLLKCLEEAQLENISFRQKCIGFEMQTRKCEFFANEVSTK